MLGHLVFDQCGQEVKDEACILIINMRVHMTLLPLHALLPLHTPLPLHTLVEVKLGRSGEVGEEEDRKHECISGNCGGRFISLVW